MKLLKLNDTITVAGLNFLVEKGFFEKGYFLELIGDVGNTDKIFEIIGVDKNEFQQQVLGKKNYPSPSGRFPFCRTLEDLTKFVEALEMEFIKKSYKSEYGLDISPEPIKKDNKLNNFLLLNL